MNVTQIKCLAVFAVFAVIGFGPISPGCLIGLFIVAVRPAWFWQLTINLYAAKASDSETIGQQACRTIRIKCFLSLLTLFVIDILPVPVTPVIAFVIILSRPRWFYRTVAGVYGEKLGSY